MKPLEFVQTYPMEIFALLLLGVILGIIVSKAASKEWVHNMVSKAGLIQTYWKFVTVFAIFCVLVYVLIFLFASTNQLPLWTDIAGQALTLVFAIFVGWYAFLQVVENRTEKFQEKAHEYFQEGSYRRARELYEKVYIVQPENFTNLAELLELNLVTQDYQAFDKRIQVLKDITIEDDEHMLVEYLLVISAILKEDLGTAKLHIQESIKCAKEKPRALPKFTWSFKELQSSDTYKKLEGDSKKILDNYLLYLKGKLDKEKTAIFENGTFALI